ncbi:FKBP-type peptidyl-prolyl cis-trans isomerase [Mucilaginibacter panaciglaebae]|uniref:Peptidyl-prolyl cis-trans isomerase n=1 Tax=Mucilaginibacter panaciglaebae TaxID=502331 RepID=A0ABP7WZ06_9SPHI
MKRYLLLLGICAAVTFSACRKTVQSPFDASQQAKYDDKAIQDYFLLNQITDVTKDPSGLYYHIDTPGTGAHPTSSSNVVVNYTGFLLDETPFDAQSSYYFQLANFDIEGWRIGLPLIGKGGTITLYIPSGLAFGEKGSSKVPGNTCLIYHITLQGFSD